jgi:hypothetical protein
VGMVKLMWLTVVDKDSPAIVVAFDVIQLCRLIFHS